MEVENAIRTRRTIKAFEADPVDRATLEELLELARWAPNHHLTNPWRFRVLGPRALEALKGAAADLARAAAPEGADPEDLGRVAAAKLDRAPTLVVVSAKHSADPVQDEEDAHATACAAYNVLLGAHARGLAGYWRTPGVLRTEAGADAVGLPGDERFVGMLYLGRPCQTADAPERAPVTERDLPRVSELPVRGAGVRSLAVPLPPARMPLLRGTRPRKRWRYVGYYGPELMLCVADARIGPVPQRWWAVALPDGTLHGRTTIGRGGVSVVPGTVKVRANGIEIDLELDESGGVEIASPTGAGHYIWTRKQADVPAHGSAVIHGRRHAIEGVAFIDESAGYHDRHTAWKWSAGNGLTSDGRSVSWNLVTGVHDAPTDSERTVWIDREPSEVGPVTFAPDLSQVTFAEGGSLEFTEWSAREEDTNMLLMRSRYRQPFGTFTGTLPGGIELAQGSGVMEEHDVRW